MELKEYKARVIDKKIDTYLKIFGAVLIEGPKWCGKTRTSRFHSQSQFFLANPKGNFNNKRIAEMDPDLVLDGSTPRLIDEWQEAPAIWDAVRGRVDRSMEKGQFLLTGSATVNKERYIHTGTGRIARLRRRPMSLFEYGVSDGKVS